MKRKSLKTNSEQSEIERRFQTITSFLKKEYVEAYITKINQQCRKKKSKAEMKISKYLTNNIKPNIKNHMYIHELWGDQYYKRVMKRANLTEKLFIQDGQNLKLTPVKKLEPAEKQFNLYFEPETKQMKLDQGTVQYEQKFNLEEISKKLLYQTQKREQQIEKPNCYRDFYNLVKSRIDKDNKQNKSQNYQLLQKCQTYNHLRKKQTQVSLNIQSKRRESSNSNISQIIKTNNRSDLNLKSRFSKSRVTSTSTPTLNNIEKSRKLSITDDIIKKCDSFKLQSNEIKANFKAFDAFCGMIDKRLNKKWKQINKDLYEDIQQ